MSLLDDCRIIQFREEMENMVLTNHVIRSDRVTDQEICKLKCYLEPKCVSYNYGPLMDGSLLCELNDRNHVQVPSDEFKAKDGFIYSPIFVRIALTRYDDLREAFPIHSYLTIIYFQSLFNFQSTTELPDW